MFENQNQKKFNWVLPIIALSALFCACSNIETSGTSEEAEGVVAVADKRLAGVSQKGPFVKGSDVTLKETSKNGDFEPTGREFTTKTRSNKGDFKFDDFDLESQYALLSVEGYYKREYNDEKSDCPMRLDAVSNVEKRENVNINLLTHFEYKRVLNLVKEGKSFAEAKKQAATEVLDAFGVKAKFSSPEDLDIYNTSDADRVLFNISVLIDSRPEWTYWVDDEKEDCPKLQNFLDGFTEDFADDGVLSDSTMLYIVSEAYIMTVAYVEMELVDDEDIKDKKRKNPDDNDLATKKSEYEFSKSVFLHYMGVEACTDNLWGEYRKFKKPVEINDEIIKSGYLLCNGYYWEITTKEHIDSLTQKIEHENGTMTDKRDGKKYKTVSFKHKGKKYEWMAEDLHYTDSSIKYSKGSDGSYSWTTAMQIDDKYMEGPVKNGLLDSLHQGICPDGWHISTSEEWTALFEYVENPHNLLDENWKSSDTRTALVKDLIGVFFNRFDFNLTIMDSVFLGTYYHAYTLDEEVLSYDAPAFDEEDPWKDPMHESFNEDYAIENPHFSALEISVRWNDTFGVSKAPKAYVRCVKN